MKRTRRLSLIAFVAIVLPVSLAGCRSTDPPGEDYVNADEKTFTAVAPRLTAYVEKDDSLEPWQKDSVKDTLKSWKARTAEARKVLDANKGKGSAAPVTSGSK